MGRSYAPMQLVLHAPTTEEGKRTLAKKVAEIHADALLRQAGRHFTQKTEYFSQKENF